MSIVTIAFVLSITALVVSIMFAMFLKRVKQDGGKLEEQQLQLTRTLESSRVKMESAFQRLENLESSRVKMESAFQRLENVESKIADFDVNGKAEREKRGIIELKKALLSFQEARSLINDDETVRKILKIEEDMKSTLVLPEGKEAEVENKEEDDALTAEVGEKPAPEEKEMEEKIAELEIGNEEDDALTAEVGKEPAPEEKELEEIIAEPEIGKEEERNQTGELEIIEALAEIAEPEEEKEETVTETKENGIEVQSSETEERIEEKINEEITEPLFEIVEEEIPLSEEKEKAE